MGCHPLIISWGPTQFLLYLISVCMRLGARPRKLQRLLSQSGGWVANMAGSQASLAAADASGVVDGQAQTQAAGAGGDPTQSHISEPAHAMTGDGPVQTHNSDPLVAL